MVGAVLFGVFTSLMIVLAVMFDPALFALRMYLSVAVGLVAVLLAGFSRRGAMIDVVQRTIIRWSGFRGPLIKRRRVIADNGVIVLTHVRAVRGGLDRFELVVKVDGRPKATGFAVSETHDAIAAHQRADIIAEALELRIRERSIAGTPVRLP